MTPPPPLDYESRSPRSKEGVSLADLFTWIILACAIFGLVIVPVAVWIAQMTVR